MKAAKILRHIEVHMWTDKNRIFRKHRTIPSKRALSASDTSLAFPHALCGVAFIVKHMVLLAVSSTHSCGCFSVAVNVQYNSKCYLIYSLSTAALAHPSIPRNRLKELIPIISKSLNTIFCSLIGTIILYNALLTEYSLAQVSM